MTFFISNKPVVCHLPNNIQNGHPSCCLHGIACMIRGTLLNHRSNVVPPLIERNCIHDYIKGICSILDIITFHTLLEFICMINVLNINFLLLHCYRFNIVWGWCRYCQFQLFYRSMYSVVTSSPVEPPMLQLHMCCIVGCISLFSGKSVITGCFILKYKSSSSMSNSNTCVPE